MFRRLFQAHPASVGETYLEHMVHAAYFGSRMLLAGLACLIHALIPSLFQSTGREVITELYTKMVTHRRATATDTSSDASRQVRVT